MLGLFILKRSLGMLWVRGWGRRVEVWYAPDETGLLVAGVVRGGWSGDPDGRVGIVADTSVVGCDRTPPVLWYWECTFGVMRFTSKGHTRGVLTVRLVSS